MKFVLIFIILFLLLILQAGLVSNLGFGKAGNLILVFTVITIILSDFDESFFTVLVGGLMLDLVSSFRAGIIVISFLAVFGFTYLFINKLVTREPNKYILAICIGLDTIIFSVTFVLMNILLSTIHLDSLADWHYILGQKLLLDLIINIVLIYPLLVLNLWTQKSYEFVRKKLS